jgi:hypothetical protein
MPIKILVVYSNYTMVDYEYDLNWSIHYAINNKESAVVLLIKKPCWP